MLGSMFIAEVDRSKFTSIESLDLLDSLPHVYLNRMTTIDFAVVLTPTDIQWDDGEPVFFSEVDGASLCKISEAALAFVMENFTAFPPEFLSDLHLLASFVNKHGPSSIYEYATF